MTVHDALAIVDEYAVRYGSACNVSAREAARVIRERLGEVNRHAQRRQEGRTQGVLTATFPQVIEALYRDKHTGPVIFHFAQGHPNAVELPKEPERISLTRGTAEAQT